MRLILMKVALIENHSNNALGERICKNFVENFLPWSSIIVFNGNSSSWIVCSFSFSSSLNYFVAKKQFSQIFRRKNMTVCLLIMLK